MIRFATRTAIGCRAMIDALIADGNPAQFIGHKRKVATTTADHDTLQRIAREQKISIFVQEGAIILPVNPSRYRAATPVSAAIGLGRCSRCDALRGDPCRTPSNKTRMPHKGRT